MTDGPLSGVRVLEIGNFIAGPFAGQLLGDYGADVIKVETPDGGDPMRTWGITTDDGDGLWWPTIGRNKRSITADLRTEEGRQLVRSLALDADVVVENFRPGRLRDWDLDYESIARDNPGVIVVHVSGYGQSGPRSHEAGFGSIGEAMGGIRHTTGDPDRPPARCGVSLGDSLAGMFAVIGTLAALHEREQSGRGQEVDVAIYEAVAALMESTMADFEVGAVVRDRSGGALPGVAPANAYPTADGSELLIAGNADSVFRRLCAVMGQPELADDVRFADHAARGANADTLDALVADWTCTRPSDELLRQLADSGIPAGRVYTAPDMLADEHYAARDMVLRAKARAGFEVPMTGIVPRFSRTPGRVRDVGPDLGEHDDDVAEARRAGRSVWRTPDGGSGPADPVSAAATLVPLLTTEADLAASERRLTQPVLDAVADAGLFSLVTPARWGGHEAGLDDLAQVTRTLAHGCPASAWTLSFFMLHNWLVSKFPQPLVAEVFADRPYAFIPAPLAPTGTIEPVAGGYRVSGRWEWATGVNHADWVMVHGIDLEAGATRFAVLPIDEVVVEDVWFTSGMRATGSNAVVITDRVVPTDRTVPAQRLLDGAPDSTHPLDRLPVMAVLALVAAAPAVGAAEAAVDLFRDRIHQRVLAYTLGDRQVDQPAAQIRLAAAMAEARSARAVWDRAIGELVEAGAHHGGPPLDARSSARLAAASAVRLARSAISTVCEGSGASIYAETSPFQRLQRDVEVLKGHVVFDWDRTAELVGRVALGLELRPTDLL